MRLKKGDKLTDLSLPSVKGNVFNIENIAGKKALISFYRFAQCPFCNLRIHELTKRYDELENKLEIIAIFDSPLDHLIKTQKSIKPLLKYWLMRISNISMLMELKNLYSNFFPYENFISMQASVIDKDIDLLLYKQPSEILFKIFANVNDNIIINSLKVDSTSKLINLNCSFINEIERANFINALTRAGINLNQVDSLILNDLEQFKYEYKYE